MHQIYVVTTEGDCEGRSTKHLAYAVGNVEDIKHFYKPQAMYEIEVTPISVVRITPESSGRRDALLQQKADIEAQLKKVKEQLL